VVDGDGLGPVAPLDPQLEALLGDTLGPQQGAAAAGRRRDVPADIALTGGDYRWGGGAGGCVSVCQAPGTVGGWRERGYLLRRLLASA